MKDILVCAECKTPIERTEAYLTNALAFSCADCFEEWDVEEGLLEDTYCNETYYERG